MIYPINESLHHFQMSKLSKQMRIYTILFCYVCAYFPSNNKI